MEVTAPPYALCSSTPHGTEGLVIRLAYAALHQAAADKQGGTGNCLIYPSELKHMLILENKNRSVAYNRNVNPSSSLREIGLHTNVPELVNIDKLS